MMLMAQVAHGVVRLLNVGLFPMLHFFVNEVIH